MDVVINSLNQRKEMHFYAFPKRKWEVERRKIWINFARRQSDDKSPWLPSDYSVICSDHFLGQERSNDPRSPSYNPSIHPVDKPKEDSSPLSGGIKISRYERLRKRQSLRNEFETDGDSTTPSPSSPPSSVDVDAVEDEPRFKSMDVQTDFEVEEENFDHELQIFLCHTLNDTSSTQVATKKIAKKKIAKKKIVEKKNASCGPDSRVSYFSGHNSIESNPQALNALAGVSHETFDLFRSCLPESSHRNELSREDKLLLLLMKMKLGITFNALGPLFGVHASTASKVFINQLNMSYQLTKDWILWPSKFSVMETLPPCFAEHYPETRVIIDCTEMRTEKPPTVNLQVLMYSHYKGAYTVKFLIGIAPSGMITFLSCGYGGRATDSFITVNSGIIEKLEPGDNVMADKGFPQIEEDLSKNNCVLVMPPFADSTQPQFSEESMTTTRKIAAVRIHVERAIARVKIYKILSSTIQIDILPHIDKIMHLSCVLANLQPEIIKQNEE